MRKLIPTLISLTIIFAFAPWVNEAEVSRIIKQKFSTDYRQNLPKYSGPCELLKLENMHRVAFGYKANVTWKCGHRNTESGNIYVTFLKTTIGVPLE